MRISLADFLTADDGRGGSVRMARPAAEVLTRELEGFKVKITPAANETFGTWRDGEHDDLVLAVALAVSPSGGSRP
jgi:hypothetical protein